MSRSDTTADADHLSGAEALVAMLGKLEVDTVFGLCGDTTLPWYDALARMEHGIRHFLTRDERHAAYMADAYARISGRVGVCEGPSGGGATYILPGVVEANESSVPILAITTDVSTSARGRFPLTELDQKALFRPLTKFNDMLDDAATLPAQLRETFRQMTTGRPGAAHLGLPFDTQKGMVQAREVWADASFGRYPAEPVAADEGEAEKLLEVLASAKQPVIICGGGVVLAGAEEALDEFARNLGCVVLTTVSGQGSLAETHALCAGVVGSNGGVPETRHLVEQADAVFFIGCRAGSVTTERWRYPSPTQRIVHLDNDAAVLNCNYPTEAAMLCDARLGLERLNRLWRGRPALNNGAAKRVAEAWRSKLQRFDALANADHSPIRPERVIRALMDQLPDDAIVCADPGTPCPYFSAYYRWPKAGRCFITNRAHGALGYAMAAAMGAHIAAPERKVIAAMGDGSFAFCAGELETLKRYNIPVVMLVFSNACYGWIKAGQKSGFEKRYYNVDFSRTDHAAVASAYGIRSFTVEQPGQLDPVLDQALAMNEPVMIDVISQPLQDSEAPVSEWVA